MIELTLSGEKRARIWFDNLEGCMVQSPSSRVLQIPRLVRATPHREMVVVEMFVPAGGRFEYGLLGATASDAGAISDQITVEIPVTASSGSVYPDSLAGQLDTVRWGLPAEYADAVADGAREALADCAPDASRICFAWGAHGYLGSSSRRFRRLAALVIRLLVAPKSADLKLLVEEA